MRDSQSRTRLTQGVASAAQAAPAACGRRPSGIVQSDATSLCDHEGAQDKTEHPGQQEPLDHESLDSFANVRVWAATWESVDRDPDPDSPVNLLASAEMRCL